MNNWFIDYHHALLLRLLVLGLLVATTIALTALGRALMRHGKRAIRQLPTHAALDTSYPSHPVRHERSTQSMPLVR